MQQWRITVKGKRRKTVDVGLIVQAVIALGKQLHDDAAKQAETSVDAPSAPEDEL